jgi:hypothetical protein
MAESPSPDKTLRSASRLRRGGSVLTWRERVGIEPTSRLTTASAILKTVRTTRFVRSHVTKQPVYFQHTFRRPSTVGRLVRCELFLDNIDASNVAAIGRCGNIGCPPSCAQRR